MEDKRKTEKAVTLEKLPEPASRSETSRPTPSVERLKTKEAVSSRTEKSAETGVAVPLEARPEERGKFLPSYDGQGRVNCVEGWLSPHAEPRSSADKKVQQDFRKEHGLTKDQDAFHVIAHVHGGPNVERHGRRATGENLVGGDAVMNKSHHKMFENQITDDLIAGRQIYCRADVYYKDQKSRNAERIEYRYFTPGKDGKLEPYDKVPGYTVRPEQKSQPVKPILEQHGVPDFYKHSHRPDQSGDDEQVQ